jgi:hypothetical protein
MLTSGVLSILSVEDLGICNNAQKNSFIVLFCKEFGNDNSVYRVTCYGSTADFVARNLITTDGKPYVTETGIAGYCQKVSKEDRKANKVKIHARRVFMSGELEVSYGAREVSGTKIAPIGGVMKKIAMTITAEVPSTKITATTVQFIDAKAKSDSNAVQSADGNEEINYALLADSVIEDANNVNDTVGNFEEKKLDCTITADDAKDTIDPNAVIELEANDGPNLNNFKGR